jgi:hypothetical protein
VPAADKPTRRTLHQREAIVPAPLPIRADNPADERYSVRGGLATVGIGLVLGAGYLIVNGGIGALAVEPVIGQPVAPAEATPPLAATTSAPASPTPSGYRPAAPHIRRGGASAPARPAISAEPVARPPEPGPPTPAPTTSPPAPTPSGSPDPETSTRPSPSTSPDPVGSGAAAKPAGR